MSLHINFSSSTIVMLESFSHSSEKLTKSHRELRKVLRREATDGRWLGKRRIRLEDSDELEHYQVTAYWITIFQS